jgi:hypothetical protein
MIYDGCPFAYFFFTICLKSDLHARNLTIYIVHLYYNMFIFLSFRQLLVTLHIKNNLVSIAYNYMQKKV